MQSSELFVVGIGASAGGHEPLKDFFSNLDPDLPAAYVVVTHLLRSHRSQLARIISRYTKLPVKEMRHIEVIRPGHVYVMPENVTLEIHDDVLYPIERNKEIINRAIDIFFESLAQDKKEKAVGIVLSGMGSDGAHGALSIFKHQGDVLVQDPDSAQFSSMPWATIVKDHPDYILPPQQLAEQLGQMLKEKLERVSR